jgi:hypothetical protein
VSTIGTLAIILAIAIAVELYRAYRVDDRYIARWARERGLELTAENRAMVTRYVRRARVFRTWGGVAGAVLPSLLEYVINGRVQVLGFGSDGNNAPLGFGSIFVGYLVGALCAELSTVRPARGARRRASLVPRELTSYVPRRVVLAQRIAAVAGAAGTVAIAAVPYPASTSNPGSATLALIAVLVLALGAGLEAVERWFVRRPQPYADPALVAADDTIRAQSIRAVAGAGLAVLLLYCSGVSLALQAADVAVLQATMPVPAVVCLVGSLLACSGISDGPWRVRRPARATGAVSA